MTPETLIHWRRDIMRLRAQRDAARMLGVALRTYADLERGIRPVMLQTELACAALALGLRRYEPPAVYPYEAPSTSEKGVGL